MIMDCSHICMLIFFTIQNKRMSEDLADVLVPVLISMLITVHDSFLLLLVVE